MNYFDLVNLNFKQIRVFLVAAESESFSEAAKKLNFTQSMISKTISSLEKDLGLMLFYRKKANNSLTPAGRSLLNDWKSLYSQVEDSLERAHVAQTGAGYSLSMGSVDTMIMSEELVAVVQRFSAAHPEIAFQYDEYPISELLNLGKQQKLDVIVTAAFDAATLETYGYAYRLLIQSRVSVYVHRSNPLAQRERLSVEDLRSENFIILSPATNPNFVTMLNTICGLHGFEPRISTYVSNAHSYEMNLLKGQGVVLADNFINIQHDEIKQFVIEDLYSGIIIAWLKSALPNVQRFIEIVDEFFPSQTE